MEVTLNHNINQFLLLAPESLRFRLFHHFFSQNFEALFEMHGRGVDTTFNLADAMQPDFLFVSRSEAVSIEMKVGAKSSLAQVLKYALLGLAVELRDGSTRRHFLGFLGARDFSHQWKEKYRSPSDLKRALSTVDLAVFLHRCPVRFRKHLNRFEEILDHLAISFMSYREFAEIVRAESPASTDISPGAEVYRNLISGLLLEFERRNLLERN
jgi:hypothetical protein